MSKISFSKFVWAMAAILWTFTPQAPAQAQSTLLNALSSSGVYRILNSSDAVYSRSFTTDASATVTSMVVRMANSGLQNSGTLSAGIDITVGGNAFSFSSYNSNGFLTTFTGNAVLAANTTYEIRFVCSNCDTNSFAIYEH